MGRHEFVVRSPREKSALLTELGLAAAEEPIVRETIFALFRGLSSWQHLERLRRIQRFVAGLPYVREPIEDFPAVAEVLRRGGDCDDQALLGVALCWAARYPAMAWPARPGPEGWAGHYQVRCGWPEAEEPEGDQSTTWLVWETTLPSSRALGFPA